MFKKIFDFALGLIIGSILLSSPALFIISIASPTSLSNVWIICGIIICSTLPLAIFFTTKSAQQYVVHVVNIYQKCIYYTAIPVTIGILYITPISAVQKTIISIAGLILSSANIYYLEKIKDENNHYMYFYLAQITMINLLSLKFILEGQIFSICFMSALIIYNYKKFFYPAIGSLIGVTLMVIVVFIGSYLDLQINIYALSLITSIGVYIGLKAEK